MGHHQGGLFGSEAGGDGPPGAIGAIPHLVDGFALRHLHGFRRPFPVGQQLGPALRDLLLQAAFPQAVADFHQAAGAGEGHTRVAGQDCLGRLAGAGHGAGVGPVNRHGRQEAAGRLRLGLAIGVQGDVDLPLEAALAVPVRFPVTHQQQA